jgi:hypothetical protein
VGAKVITVVKTADDKTYRFDRDAKTYELEDVCFDYLAAVPMKVGLGIQIFHPTQKGSCAVGKISTTDVVVSIRSGEELDASRVS